jgi:hypothetical protein
MGLTAAALVVVAWRSRPAPRLAGAEPTLRDEVDSLRAEVAALRAGRAEAAASLGRALATAGTARTPAEPQQQPPPSEPPPPSPPAQRVTADSLAARMSAGLTTESRDPSWAPSAETTLYAALRAEAFKDTSLKSVECRATMCRIELSHRDRDAQSRFTQAVNDVPLFQNTEYFAHGQDREWKHYVLYLAREGHKLPRPES